jgi:hypothetical protein
LAENLQGLNCLAEKQIKGKVKSVSFNYPTSEKQLLAEILSGKRGIK